MRKALALILSLFVLTIASHAQEHQVKVTLKTGTTIVGRLVSLDPVNSIEIKIGDIECKIPITEVATIESATDTTQAGLNADKEELNSTAYGEYLVTDKTDYPDSISVSICNRKFTMILVRGGMFNMGFDGDGSASMESEPVHRVEVSSFYVLKNFIPDYIAYNFLDPNQNKPKGEKFVTLDWSTAKQIVDDIATLEKAPYRLLTEAEWEYAAIQPVSESIFEEIINSTEFSQGKYAGEWCNDFKSEYSSSKQVNPQGPKKGRRHIVRAFAPDNNKWSRNTKHFSLFFTEYYNYFGYFVRFAINADSITEIK